MTTHPIRSDTPHHVFEPGLRHKIRDALALLEPELVPVFTVTFVRFAFAAKASARKNRPGPVWTRLGAWQDGERLRRQARLRGRRYGEDQALVDQEILKFWASPRNPDGLIMQLEVEKGSPAHGRWGS